MECALVFKDVNLVPTQKPYFHLAILHFLIVCCSLTYFSQQTAKVEVLEEYGQGSDVKVVHGVDDVLFVGLIVGIKMQVLIELLDQAVNDVEQIKLFRLLVGEIVEVLDVVMD